ncbi:unnamed protein product [Gongylonema pulchrum]|uniref:Uncharacterized protein n=1 Tax=Gongylonema pulchrum TaxID=637853 RepID=A0A183E8R8_9BILA|nr:unnamed protein product [Gongylonema pulchrum]
MDIAQFWKLELLGIKESPNDDDDGQAMQQFQESIGKEGERYSVGWPWRSPEIQLTSNFGLCFGRLKPPSTNFVLIPKC